MLRFQRFAALALVLGCCSCSANPSPSGDSPSNNTSSKVDPQKETLIRKQLDAVQKYIDQGSESACRSALNLVDTAAATAEVEALLGRGGISDESKRRLGKLRDLCK